MIGSLDRELRTRIERFGSIRFDEFVELALYHPDGGFFAGGGGAGRAGADFVTSPEVGPLFGAVVASYLDARWDDLGRPDPFVVVEAGAGRGALAISVLAASPACAAALRYVLVERSEALRARHGEHLSLVHPFEVLGPDDDPEFVGTDRGPGARAVGPLVCTLPDLPAERVTGVVIANELLDNVPFRLLERGDDGWSEVRVATDASQGDGSAADATPSDGAFVELLVPADDVVARHADAVAPRAPRGARLPIQDGAVEWLAEASGVLDSGSVLVVDYAAPSAELVQRPSEDWLRTYRNHERGTAPLDAPGSQDITCEVAFDQLDRVARPDAVTSQAEWLRRWGIDDLVEEGRRIWERDAARPDLAAMRARSRVSEAAALLDPAGLGAFKVLEWRR